MRSVVQTHTQPTQQHHCPLSGSEYYYMYWLHELRGPSCDCLPPRVNKGLVLPCPLVADKLHPCLECRWLACKLRSWRFLCSETRTALSCSRWFWETLPNFSELHYWAPFGDEFLSLSCPAFALSRNQACNRPTQRRLSVLYPADALRTEGTHPGHIPGKFWLLLASARARWQVRLTQQRRHLVLCHPAPLWHLRGIEQCPTWCPVWVSLYLTVMENMVGSRERKIHRGYHHETEMQHTISRKGYDHFSAMTQVH